MNCPRFLHPFSLTPHRLVFGKPDKKSDSKEYVESLGDTTELEGLIHDRIENDLPPAVITLLDSNKTKHAPKGSDHSEEYYQEGGHKELGPELQNSFNLKFETDLSGKSVVIRYEKFIVALQRCLNKKYNAGIEIDAEGGPETCNALRMAIQKEKVTNETKNGLIRVKSSNASNRYADGKNYIPIRTKYTGDEIGSIVFLDRPEDELRSRPIKKQEPAPNEPIMRWQPSKGFSTTPFDEQPAQEEIPEFPDPKTAKRLEAELPPTWGGPSGPVDDEPVKWSKLD